MMDDGPAHLTHLTVSASGRFTEERGGTKAEKPTRTGARSKEPGIRKVQHKVTDKTKRRQKRWGQRDAGKEPVENRRLNRRERRKRRKIDGQNKKMGAKRWKAHRR